MLRTYEVALAALLLSAVCGRAGAQAPQAVTAEQKAEEKAEEKAWRETCKDVLGKASSGKEPLFLTGPKTGYYYKVGNAIAAVLAEKKIQPGQPALKLEPISTAQTTCNLLGLETNNAAFALVQSDIAHDAWFGHPPVRYTASRSISLVAPLYVEAVHIVVRPHLNLARLTDLRGRRVWLGVENSLTVLTAKRILDAAGLTPEQVEALETCAAGRPCPDVPIRRMSGTDALKALEELKLDAMFQVGAVPFDTLRDPIVPSDGDGHLLDAEQHKDACDAVRQARSTDPTINDSELHLFNLDLDLVNRLVDDGSYIEQLIPASAYCQANATLTVGVRALLLTNRDASDPLVSRLARAILDNQREIETKLREEVEQEQKAHGDTVTGQPSKLALLRVPTPGPFYARYHATIKQEKIYFNPWKRIAERDLPILGVVVLVGSLVLYRWRRVIGPAIVDHGEWPLGLVCLALAWVVVSLVLKNFEGAVNEDFSSVPTALSSTLLNLVGYGAGPITQKGQYLWKWSSWCIRAAFFGIFLPSIWRSLGPKCWNKIKSRLERLGEKPAPRSESVKPAHRRSAPTD